MAHAPPPIKFSIKLLEWIMPLVFFSLAIFAAGIALGAAAWVFDQLKPATEALEPWLRYPAFGMLLGLCYYVYGMSLMLVVPVLTFPCHLLIKPYRGPAVTPAILPWYIESAFVMLVRYSFLEFVCPTVFQRLFYRLMGMKIGRNVEINSTNIVDPSLIEMEDHVTIGGSANLMAHYGQAGFLVIAPLKIRKGATIGLRATLMGGVEVGERAKVLANSFVLPGTTIPAGETWGGVPAVKLDMHDYRQRPES